MQIRTTLIVSYIKKSKHTKLFSGIVFFHCVIRAQMLMNYANSQQLPYDIEDNQQLAYAMLQTIRSGLCSHMDCTPNVKRADGVCGRFDYMRYQHSNYLWLPCSSSQPSASSAVLPGDGRHLALLTRAGPPQMGAVRRRLVEGMEVQNGLAGYLFERQTSVNVAS